MVSTSVATTPPLYTLTQMLTGMEMLTASSPPMHTSFILANIRYPGLPRNIKVLPAHQMKLNIGQWLILEQRFAGYVLF